MLTLTGVILQVQVNLWFSEQRYGCWCDRLLLKAENDAYPLIEVRHFTADPSPDETKEYENTEISPD
ncbi:MAG: hypothetical protein WCD18_24625 [Thermosynechococcaceae cyanobacterium]